MIEPTTYIVTVSSGTGKQDNNGTIYSEKDRLDMKREDYFFKVREQNAERRQINSILNGEYSDLMKLLTSLSTAGIGAMLFKQDSCCCAPAIFWISVVFMMLSLVFAALSYIFSIRSLSAWSRELEDLGKDFEEMQQISNDLLHFGISLSGISFAVSCICYICYVAQ